MLSKADWERQLEGKTPYAAAQHIIGNLTGYRSTSIHRTADTDLTRAIEALCTLTVKKTSEM